MVRFSFSWSTNSLAPTHLHPRFVRFINVSSLSRYENNQEKAPYFGSLFQIFKFLVTWNCLLETVAPSLNITTVHNKEGLLTSWL